MFINPHPLGWKGVVFISKKHHFFWQLNDISGYAKASHVCHVPFLVELGGGIGGQFTKILFKVEID